MVHSCMHHVIIHNGDSFFVAIDGVRYAGTSPRVEIHNVQAIKRQV